MSNRLLINVYFIMFSQIYGDLYRKWGKALYIPNVLFSGVLG